MTIEELKAEAKNRFNKELTDEQAKAFLESQSTRELADEELENVAGGGCSDKVGKPVDSLDSCEHFICKICGGSGHQVHPDMWMSANWRHYCSDPLYPNGTRMNDCQFCVCCFEGFGLGEYSCQRDYMLETGWQG